MDTVPDMALAPTQTPLAATIYSLVINLLGRQQLLTMKLAYTTVVLWRVSKV